METMCYNVLGEELGFLSGEFEPFDKKIMLHLMLHQCMDVYLMALFTLLLKSKTTS